MRARARRRHHHGVPGADDLAQPAAHDRAADRRDPRSCIAGCRTATARARTLELLALVGIRDAREPARRLSAPALRRAAPARHDRHGARQRAGPVHRRRADDGARRHRAGADPEPARRPEAPPRHGDAVHHPRSRHRAQDRRPRLRHAARARSSSRAGRRDLRATRSIAYTQRLLAAEPKGRANPVRRTRRSSSRPGRSRSGSRSSAASCSARSAT